MRRTFLAGLLLLAGGAPVLAAKATVDEAKRLVDVFHRYLGAPRAGQADHVRAEPQESAYRLTVDLDPLVVPFQPAGFGLEGAEFSFLAEPLSDGTWRVSDMAVPSVMTLRLADVVTTLRWEGVTFDGIYDPALAAFTTFEEVVGPSSSESRGPNEHSISRAGEQRVTGSATPAAGTAVDGTMRHTMSTMSASQTVPLPQTVGATPPDTFEFSYGIVSGAADYRFEAFESAKLLELWAYAVAHLQEQPPKIDSGEVKSLARGTIPIFRRIETESSLKGLTIETPFGGGGIDDMSGTFGFTGIVPEAGFDLFMQMSGPTYPEQTIPAWAKGLLPSGLEFGMELSGVNLDASVRHVIDALDFDSEPVLSEAAATEAFALALPPDGPARFRLHSGLVQTPLASVRFEGEIANLGPMPSGTLRIDVTGLEEAIAALQSETADPAAQQLLGALSVAQMTGERQADGTTRFQFEASRDGAITLNGTMLKPPASRDL